LDLEAARIKGNEREDLFEPSRHVNAASILKNGEIQVVL
jgi:hypothetical protein